jgi:hypothetical protein
VSDVGKLNAEVKLHHTVSRVIKLILVLTNENLLESDVKEIVMHYESLIIKLERDFEGESA